MRPAQKQNRARGRGNRKGGGGGNSVNRVYESAGPEGKVRGTPQQIVDKYLSLARDAQTAGDRVTAENFLQHAEHYQRILLAATGAQGERREQPSEDDDDQDDRASMNGQAHEIGDGRDGDGEDGDDAGDGRRRGRRRRANGGRGDDAPTHGEDGEPERGDEARLSGDADGPLADATPTDRPNETHDIGGLATIDTGDGDGQGDLLVSTEEMTKSPPRKRRTRSRPKEAAEGEAEAAAGGDAPTAGGGERD